MSIDRRYMGALGFIRKGALVGLAVILACSLVPLLPQQGLAQRQDEAGAPRLLTQMAFDLTDPDGSAFIQEHPLNALFAAEGVDKPAIPQAAVDAACSELGVEDGSEVDVAWCGYLESDAPVIEGTCALSAEEAGDAWRFVVSEEVESGDVARVDVPVTKGAFRCSMAADLQRSGVVEMDLGEDAHTVSYEVCLSNAQDEDARALSQIPAPDALTYQTETKICALPLQAKGVYEVRAAARQSDDLEVKAVHEDGRLSVAFKPKRMFPSEEVSVELSWGSWRSSVSIPLQQPAKKAVRVAVDDQPFRLLGDQAKAVRSDLVNQAEGLGFAHEDLQNGEGRTIEPFDFDGFALGYPSPLTMGPFSVEGVVQLNALLSDRYALANDRFSFQVSAVEEEPGPERLFVNGAASDNWVNTIPVARYEGHRLSSQLAEGYEAELPMNAAEGSYVDQLIFARSEEDGVITQIRAAYNLDMTPPAFIAITVDGEQQRFDDTLFMHDAAHIIISATDPACSAAAVEENAVSGLSAEGAHIEYVDSGEGRTHIKEGIQLSDDRASGTFAFDIEGDQNVPVDSIKGYLWDRAGNQAPVDMDGIKRIPEDVMRVVADAAPPTLSVSFDRGSADAGGFFNEERTGAFTVRDPHFSYVRTYDGDQPVVTITENGVAHVFRASQFTRQEGDAWSVSYRFSNDADYVVAAQARDLVGKTSERFAASFTIDRTAPALNVSFDDEPASNGKYYRTARTATISVVERNFSPELIQVNANAKPGNADFVEAAHVSGWASEGDVRACTVLFPGDGVYDLEVSGRDRALNALQTYACPEFTIDATEPEITIRINGEEAASPCALREGCGISVQVHDANLDPLSEMTIDAIGLNTAEDPYEGVRDETPTDITFSGADLPHIPENDGIYQLQVTARDLAGNNCTEMVEWSVNRFGSTYLLDERTRAMVGRRCIRPDDLCDVRITEINPSGLSEEKAMVSMAQGMKMRTLEKGEDYTLREKADELWPAYEYVIDKKGFLANGTYQIALNSMDAAGNSSMNALSSRDVEGATAEVSFAVDDAAPLISFSGTDVQSIPSDEHAVGVRISDNMDVASATIRVNGEEVSALGAEELSGSEGVEVTLHESDQRQVVSVRAADRAGNISEAETALLFVNADPISCALHEPGTFIFFAISAVVIAVCVLWKMRKPRMIQRLH